MTSQKEQLSYLLKSDKDLEELIKSIPKIVPFKREEYNLVLQEWDEELSARGFINNLGTFKNGYRKLFRKRNAKPKD